MRAAIQSLLFSPPFSPLSLPGLAAWWDFSDPTTLFQDAARTTAAFADGDPVGGVIDKSGNGRHLSQSTGSKRPTLKLAIQNGRAVLRFDGVDDFLSTASFATFPSKRGSIALTAGNTPTATEHILLATYHAATPDWEFGSSNNASFKPFFWYDGASSQRLEMSADVTGWSQLSLVRDSDTTISFRRNGVARAGITCANTQPAANPVFVGSVANGTGSFNGDMGEIAMFDPNLSAGNRQLLESYLKARWGTP